MDGWMDGRTDRQIDYHYILSSHSHIILLRIWGAFYLSIILFVHLAVDRSRKWHIPLIRFSFDVRE